jgi:hypothetical protein
LLDRRTFLKGAAMTGALAAPAPLRAALLQDSPFIEILPEQVGAVKRGLDFMAKIQSRRGHVGVQAPLAFTALAGLAWMAGGSTPTRGPYAVNVMNALRFVLQCARGSTGYINENAARLAGGSGMHGHGYALLFLAELYGMCGDIDAVGDDSVRHAIQRAVTVTERAQHAQGGWTYDPSPNGHEGSVTVTQVHALRAARNIGVSVSQKVVDRGISYIKKSTNADGTIMYMLGQGSHATYPLTAAGACVYAYYGLYDDPMGQKCMKALFDFVSGKRPGQNPHFDSYASFYAGQACFFMKRKDPRYWTEGYAKIRKQLLATQAKNGAWASDGYEGAFGTPCATLILQIPFRILPIFQD